MHKVNRIIFTNFRLFIILAVFTSCGGGKEASIESTIAEGDLSKVLEKKKELIAEQKKITESVALLDSFIIAQSDDVNYPLITTLRVDEKDFIHFIQLQGDVSTRQNVLVYPEVAGTLLKIYVKEGDKVKTGQLLASIDDGGLKNQLLQMRAQLALAKTTFERQERLWEQEIGTEIQYLQAKTNYEAQESAIDQMEDQLSKYSVRSPFSGIVDDLIKDQGTVVAPGQGSEIFRIVNLSKMFVEVSVPETYIASIQKGKKVKVEFPVLNETVDSYVRETGNFINPNNRTFTVEIPVPNKSGNIKPNLSARVHINDYRNENALLIPQSTISENAEGEQYAYLVTDISNDNLAVAKRVIITTGKTQDGFVEVLSGIKPGQSIIVEGARSVKERQTVKILKG